MLQKNFVHCQSNSRFLNFRTSTHIGIQEVICMFCVALIFVHLLSKSLIKQSQSWYYIMNRKEGRHLKKWLLLHETLIYCHYNRKNWITELFLIFSSIDHFKWSFFDKNKMTVQLSKKSIMTIALVFCVMRNLLLFILYFVRFFTFNSQTFIHCLFLLVNGIIYLI